MDNYGPPKGSSRMSGKTESESHALRARRAEGTEASTVIVQAGSDRPLECRIMIERGRTNEVCEREQEKQRDERERGCDDDNVSVSTDASCLTDLSLETVAEEPSLSLSLLLDAYADRAATLSIQLKHTHTHRQW